MVGEDGEDGEGGGNGRGIQCGNNGCINAVINLLVNRDQTIYWCPFKKHPWHSIYPN